MLHNSSKHRKLYDKWTNAFYNKKNYFSPTGLVKTSVFYLMLSICDVKVSQKRTMENESSICLGGAILLALFAQK